MYLKKLMYCAVATIFFISCGEKDNTIETNENTMSVVYKGQTYTISVDNDGIPLEIPKALEVLDEIETLATVVTGDQTYYFDTRKEADDYFDALIGFTKPTGAKGSTTQRRTFSTNVFNDNVHVYEHDYYGGRKLRITSGHHLRNLSLAGFNDIISSVAINGTYQNIYNGDKVTFYEHKDFGGKSISFLCEFNNSTRCQLVPRPTGYFPYDLGPSNIVYRGHLKFREISFKLFNKWADKASSIDVKFGGVSVTPRYPSSGGGGYGGGGGGIEDDPIK
ncbi:hypothetical protein ACJD0Z_18500 [Flavobacteriaceae bacterium M23B6Z8]